VGCRVENQLGASEASGLLGHQGIQGSISDSKELPQPSASPLLADPPTTRQTAAPQSLPLPDSETVAGAQVGAVFERRASVSATSAAATIIPGANAGVASPSAHPSAHVAASSLPPSRESPPNLVGEPPNSQPIATSTSASSPPKSPSLLAAPATKSVIGDPSGAFSPQDTPIPKSPSHAYHPTPQPSRILPEEVNKTSIMPGSPQPQRRASSGLPSVKSPPALTARTNSSDPQALSSAPVVHGDPLALLFGDNEDLSEPDGEKEDADERSPDDVLVDRSSHLHTKAKRPRAASSSPEPPADAPRKRRRRVSLAAKKAATPKAASHSSRPAPSPSRSKLNEADGSDMDLEIETGSEAEDKVMGGDGDEEGAAFKDPIGKGKAVNKAPPPRKTSARRAKKAHNKRGPDRGPSDDGISPLENDIPTVYEARRDRLADDELFELNWFAPTHLDVTRGKSPEKGENPKAPVPGIPRPASQASPTRRWYSFAAPRMTLDQDLEGVGEVRLSDGIFCFPFEAQVIRCFSSLDVFLTFQIIGGARRKLPSS